LTRRAMRLTEGMAEMDEYACIHTYTYMWIQTGCWHAEPCAWLKAWLRWMSMHAYIHTHTCEYKQAVDTQSHVLHQSMARTYTHTYSLHAYTCRLWTRRAMRFIKGMAEMDGAHYPERLGQMFIINCPRCVVHVHVCVFVYIHIYAYPCMYIPIHVFLWPRWCALASLSKLSS
jgi:hypothetical protein